MSLLSVEMYDINHMRFTRHHRTNSPRRLRLLEATLYADLHGTAIIANSIYCAINLSQLEVEFLGWAWVRALVELPVDYFRLHLFLFLSSTDWGMPAQLRLYLFTYAHFLEGNLTTADMQMWLLPPIWPRQICMSAVPFISKLKLFLLHWGTQDPQFTAPKVFKLHFHLDVWSNLLCYYM